MRKFIAGLAAGIVLALGGVASADFAHPHYGTYDINLNVNGNPFYGHWMIYNDRPYVGIEALSNALNLPRVHNYKAWSVAEGAVESGDPLVLMAETGGSEVDTIRLGGVTMVDLYAVAAALDLPVHHNFRNKTIQIGDEYVGHEIPGRWYRYMSRTRGWRMNNDMRRLENYRLMDDDREWEDTAPRKNKI